VRKKQVAEGRRGDGEWGMGRTRETREIRGILLYLTSSYMLFYFPSPSFLTPDS
jgi:hypothetical protein